MNLEARILNTRTVVIAMTWKDLPRNPSIATLRQFAVLCVIVFGTIGLRRLLLGDRGLGAVFLSISFFSALFVVMAPRVLRVVFVGWLIAVFPLGWLVTHTILGVIFYGVFTPLAFFFRAQGRDPLRRWPTVTDSYWCAKPAARGVADYYRQF